ncbi:NAD-binding protein [Moesziomyces antarcticus]|nr:NAD-binding protein [Moesziomyces antarcticus]GAK62756.1 NAD-binding protein [Moesziomyces antarcticus]
MASYTSIALDMLRHSPPSRSCKHWDPSTMPLLQDRIVIITGPSSGIGYETLRQLVLSSAHVYMFGRNLDKLRATASTIAAECRRELAGLAVGHARYGAEVGRMTPVQCDLGSLDSVQRAVDEFLSKEERVDVVLCNAGVMESGKTVDGYEIMWGTNVLGHHALLRLLLPALQASARLRNSAVTGETRVVLTSSDTHRWINKPSHLTPAGLDNPDRAGLGYVHLYGRSKLGNILTAKTLAAASDAHNWGITVASAHPGGVKSQLGSTNSLLTRLKNWFLVPATLGAVTQLWAATAANSELIHGRYLVPWAAVGEESDLAKDPSVAQTAWDWCEQQCTKHGLNLQDWP